MLYDADSLKKDLREMEPRDFYVKHILKTKNWYFSQFKNLQGDAFIEEIDYFREIISNKLKISFHSAKIVGSAKLGYSLSPNHPFRPFIVSAQATETSDIDIAIISAKMFESWWEEIRKTRELYRRRNEDLYCRTAKSIYRGYINEKTMYNFSGLRQHWKDVIGPVTVALQDKMSIEHPISYRIYRSWEDIQDYQIYSIFLAKKEIEKNDNV